MNLLIAQLNSSYVYIYQDCTAQTASRIQGYWDMDPRVIPQASLASSVGASRRRDSDVRQDMVGFARLNRAQKIVEAIRPDIILVSEICLFCHGYVCIVVEALSNFNRRHFAFLGLHCLNSAKWLHRAS